jgi:hypothetical protein
MKDEDKPRRWAAGDVLFVVVLLALFGLGVCRAYLTFTKLEGIRGMLTFSGRILAEFGLVFAAFAAYIGCFAIVHLITSIITGTKLRPVKIFISFKHDYENIASELEQGLSSRDIEMVKLPFDSRRTHDDVVKESLDAVSAADGVVVVPGPEPSWMANELGHAVGSRKPILVIKHLPGQHLSDSLYQGYPVFTWEKLHPNGLSPVQRFLTFATRSRGDLWPQFRRSLAGFGKLVFKGLAGWFLIYMIVKEIIETVAVFSPRKGEAIWVGWLSATFILLALTFVVGFTTALWRRRRGIAVARQKILTRTATFAELSKVFSLLPEDAPILNVLEREPLEPRHE